METFNEKLKELIYSCMEEKGIDCSLDFDFNIDDDPKQIFHEITDQIECNSGFDREIIYYSNAIKFLAENDPSLQESLQIAGELGYYAEDLDSEMLASLLASQRCREEWYNEKDYIVSKIMEIVDELKSKEGKES